MHVFFFATRHCVINSNLVLSYTSHNFGANFGMDSQDNVVSRFRFRGALTDLSRKAVLFIARNNSHWLRYKKEIEGP